MILSETKPKHRDSQGRVPARGQTLVFRLFTMERSGRFYPVVLLAVLSVQFVYPPVIQFASAQEEGVTVTTSQPITALEGANIVLTCMYNPSTTSSSFGYLAWSKDDTIIVTYECVPPCGHVYSNGATDQKYALSADMTHSGNLTILGVELKDEATYTCSVFTSDLVLSSGETQLTVNVPPNGVVISNDWSSSYPNNSIVQIQIDQPYELRCAIASPSKPASIISWEADGIAITMDDQVDATDEEDGRLVTSYRTVHVTSGRDDTGKVLRCVVTHPTTGRTVKSNVALDIQACPSSVVINECPRAIVSGDSATLGCRAASTSPPPVLYWLHESVRVDNMSSEFQPMVAEDGSNVLAFTKQFTKADIGKDFVCCIERSSMCHQLCSEPCQPDIRYPPSNPKVVSNAPLGDVTEGMLLEINCTADANPIGPSNITWTRVDESGTAVGQTRISPLRFDAVSRGDAGMYRCTVDNGVGSSRSTHIKIRVFHGPSVTNNQESRVHGNEGDAAALTCIAEAYPAADFTWLTPDNRTITTSTLTEEVTTSTIKQTDYATQVSSLLHISNIDSAVHYGDYLCLVRNAYGKAEFAINLSGVSKPYAPHGVTFNQQLTTRTSLTVTWQPGHDGGAPQTFTVTSCLEGANGKCTIHRGIEARSFEINGLQPYTRYAVSVTGNNAFGESDPSPTARNSTSPLAPYELDVEAKYDRSSGQVTIGRSSNRSMPVPDDMCFHLEVKVIAGQRDGTCLKLNDRFRVGGDVTRSQLWLVSCGRGVCSQADHVVFPTPSLAAHVTDPEGKDMWDITTLVAIIATASVAVCFVFFIVVFLVCRRNRRRGPSTLHRQMSSRKLPTLPRTDSNGSPSPSCQEAMESLNYDGLELGAVNQYMQPYAQTSLQQAKAREREAENNQISSPTDDSSSPPPSGENVQALHTPSEGTYTTTLGQQYLPMRSPTTSGPASPQDEHTFVTEDDPDGLDFFSLKDDTVDKHGNADVATGLLIEIDDDDRRHEPSDDDDMGYYSVPKGTRAMDESTPALSAY